MQGVCIYSIVSVLSVLQLDSLASFFWKWSYQRAEKDATKQKGLCFQEISQKRKMVIKIEFKKCFPLKNNSAS